MPRDEKYTTVASSSADHLLAPDLDIMNVSKAIQKYQKWPAKDYTFKPVVKMSTSRAGSDAIFI